MPAHARFEAPTATSMPGLPGKESAPLVCPQLVRSLQGVEVGVGDLEVDGRGQDGRLVGSRREAEGGEALRPRHHLGICWGRTPQGEGGGPRVGQEEEDGQCAEGEGQEKEAQPDPALAPPAGRAGEAGRPAVDGAEVWDREGGGIVSGTGGGMDLWQRPRRSASAPWAPGRLP